MGGLALLTAPFLAQAEDMSYRYIQIGYLETDIDGFGENADGFGTRGSIGFAENFFVFTEVSKQELLNVDLDQYAVGLGGHYGLSDSVDLVGRIGWAKIELDAGGGLNADDDGYLAGVGIRAQAGEHVQLEAGAVYYDYGGGADETGVELAGRYHFNHKWAVGFEYQSISDFSTIMAAVRYSFGKK
ncbi:MAG: outer membrane beta-barrel protein [Steroidobacteraceae bacterium]